MNAYKFNPITKEYEGTQQAQLNPIQTEKQGKEVYLLPINSTFEIPPEKEEGKAIVFENNKWLLKTDYRGRKAYNNEGLLIISYIGDLKGSDKLLTEEQIEGIENGTLIWKNGEIVKYEKSKEELKTEYEQQIEVLNNKLIRDIRVLLNPNASQKEKDEAQQYYNSKMSQIEELTELINNL
jgi:hypothetical protein